MSRALLKVQHKAGYPEMIYSKPLEVCERGRVTQGAPAEPFGSGLVTVPRVDLESLVELKQVKLAWFLERPEPKAPPASTARSHRC